MKSENSIVECAINKKNTLMHYWQEVLKVMGITGQNPSSITRIEASNFQLPLEPLANSDIPLVVIIDLVLLKNITKSGIHS
jgi:hypothetical protein